MSVEMKASHVESMPVAAASPPVKNHILPLDGMRGLAILIVLGVHFYVSAGVRDYGRVGGLVMKVIGTGWVGVDLFFVLSGFLITGILIDARGAPGYFRTFYARRTLRIFPLYYLALALVFGVFPLFPKLYAEDYAAIAPHQGWLWAYLTGLAVVLHGKIFHSLGPFWSLAVEEHFYLIWPLVVRYTKTKGLLIACAVAVVVSTVSRIVMLHAGVDPLGGVYEFTLSRLDSLSMGSFLVVLARMPMGLTRWVPKTRFVLTVAAILGLAVLYANNAVDSSHRGLLLETVKYNLLSIIFGSVLLLAVAGGGILHRFFSYRPLRFFGKYSYGIYIWHAVFWGMLSRFFAVETMIRWTGSNTVGVLLFILLCGAGATGLAFISWHIYEKHFLKLKQYFEYHERPALKLLAAGNK